MGQKGYWIAASCLLSVLMMADSAQFTTRVLTIDSQRRRDGGGNLNIKLNVHPRCSRVLQRVDCSGLSVEADRARYLCFQSLLRQEKLQSDSFVASFGNGKRSSDSLANIERRFVQSHTSVGLFAWRVALERVQCNWAMTSGCTPHVKETMWTLFPSIAMT
ncbi:unnamed protein product [Ostreobium quekettii]|uniref:Secreted protein n=1 Tax=Ostreobium quekettii TaxID=121088 RepID=A0A8S1ILY7_9CHLO|nr:unnamed protein product [Ostreobium quekettii]